MYRSSSYNYWSQDSVLYTHVMASMAECPQTTTDYPTSQPHQQFLHSVLRNSHGESNVPQHHVACDGGWTVDRRNDGLDAGTFPISTLPPLNQVTAQGNIQSGAAGWQPRRVPSSYSRAFSDYSPAYNMCSSDISPAGSRPSSPMQGFQHDPRHQFQEEVSSHPYVVNDDESESRVGCASTCKWNNGYGICGGTINTARIGEHMLSYHFKSHLSADSRLACLWEDCKLGKPVRRDTIIRHIAEKHLGLKYRCKLRVASHTRGDFCGSRQNAHRPHQ